MSAAFFGFALAQVANGLEVVNIVAGGPMDQANQAELAASGNILLEPGDVITSVDGQPTQTQQQMTHIVNTLPAGSPVQIDAIDSFGTPFFIYMTPQASGVVLYSIHQPIGGGQSGGHQPHGGAAAPVHPGGVQAGHP